MALKAMHFKFAITKSPTIAAMAAPAANGDLAVAAFIMVTSVIRTLHYASSHSVSAAWKVTAAGQLFMMVTKTSRYIMSSEERVGVFSHFAHSCNKKTATTKKKQGVASR